MKFKLINDKIFSNLKYRLKKNYLTKINEKHVNYDKSTTNIGLYVFSNNNIYKES
jgi:hypothetical protein